MAKLKYKNPIFLGLLIIVIGVMLFCNRGIQEGYTTPLCKSAGFSVYTPCGEPAWPMISSDDPKSVMDVRSLMVSYINKLKPQPQPQPQPQQPVWAPRILPRYLR